LQKFQEYFCGVNLCITVREVTHEVSCAVRERTHAATTTRRHRDSKKEGKFKGCKVEVSLDGKKEEKAKQALE
jgi:hypothetical protein